MSPQSTAPRKKTAIPPTLPPSEMVKKVEESYREEILQFVSKVPALQDSAALQNGRKVLIVDDDDDIRDLVSEILSLEGYVVLEAQEGRVAMEKIGLHPDIALLIVDMNMPEMNGAQLLQLMRTMHALEEVPVLISTGNISEKVVSFAKKMNVNGILIKPFPPAGLIEKVRAQISHKKGPQP